MNSIFKHILVIESSSDTNNFVLQRAVDVAKQNHVKITVFRSFYKEVHDKKFDSGLPDDLSLFVLQQQLLICEKFNRLTDEDLDLDIIISWQAPAVTSIAAIINANKISLVMRLFHKENHLLDLFTLSVERYLTRHCELPVWLVKNNAQLPEYKILACLDIDDDTETNKALNHTILDASEQLIPLKSAELHILDCYYGESASIAINYDADSGFREGVSVKRQHMKTINKYVAAHANINGTVHLNESMPDDDIPQTADELHVGLTIIGNCKHDHFFNRMLGDSSQFLTDKISSDILVIKPDRENMMLAM